MKRGLSQRRACRLFSVARSALSYQSKLAIKDAPALVAMRRLAREYPRFVYRRIAFLLRRESFPMRFDRAWRLWRTAQLQVPRKRRRRRPASSRPRPRVPEQRHHVWAYDFVFDRCANGQVLKCLTIVDEYTRECLAIDEAGRIRSSRVIDQLARLIEPPRDSRRLHFLRGWSDEHNKKVFPGSPRTGGSSGAGAAKGAWIAVEGDSIDFDEDWLHA
jgi:putative transposase